MNVAMTTSVPSISLIFRKPTVGTAGYDTLLIIRKANSIISPRSCYDREAAEDEACQGKPVRQDDHATSWPIDFCSCVMTTSVIRSDHYFGSSPRIVTPAVVASPSFARIAEPGGRKTSTRDPN